MNVIQNKRKKKTAQRQQDYRDFNTVNPNCNDYKQPAPLENEFSIVTEATRGKQTTTYVSVTSGRGYAHSEVGLAYLDIECPAINLIQLGDNPWYSDLLTKIHIINPCQILLPHTIYDAKPETTDGKLMKFLRDEFPRECIIRIPRRHYCDNSGAEIIKKYCSDKYNFIKELVASKYYALTAIAALFKYLQYVHNIYFKENSLKLECETKFAHMQIDIDTTYKLELLTQKFANTARAHFPSLYDVLDCCVTSLGKRTLRSKILEPMCDIPSIKEVQQCIRELNDDEYVELAPNLVASLRNFNNIERLHKLAIIVPKEDNVRAAEMLINQTLQLRHCLQHLPVLRAKLQPLKCSRFREIFQCLHDSRYQTMLDHIDSVISPNLGNYGTDSSSQLHRRINCLQKGQNGLIDLLRQKYEDLIKELQTTIGNMSSEYGQVFRMNYTVQRGFHVILMIPNKACVRDFPQELEVIEVKRNTCFLTTTNVNKLNIRIKGVIEEIIIQNNVVIGSMLMEIVKEMDAIYDLSGFIATLDILLSLATVSANDGYVCPVFGNEMRIVDAVHPLLEQNIHQTVSIPNNVIATSDYNFFIITGPNMSGKTIYIKMIAILQVMAQLGCFVPAKSAQFRITDRLYSRLGFNDSIERNSSTFIMEMKTIEYILKTVTPNSLIIIDELCRSTNPKEGTQLAWSLCEHLSSIRGIANNGEYFESDHIMQNVSYVSANSQSDDNYTVGRITSLTRTTNWRDSKLCDITSPFVFMTTHYSNITALADYYFNVFNLSLSGRPSTNEQQSLIMNHRIQEGVTTATSYGIELAKTVRFTKAIIKRAFEIYDAFITGDCTPRSELKSHVARKASNIGSNLLQLIPNSQASQITCGHSIISAVYTSTEALRQKRRLRQFETSIVAGMVRQASTAADGINDDLLKIDRILYNAYGDINSIVRRVKLYDETHADDSVASLDVRRTQNESIRHLLADFVKQQTDGLIEAFVRLRFTSNRANGGNGNGMDNDSRINDHLTETKPNSSDKDSNREFNDSRKSEDFNISRMNNDCIEACKNAITPTNIDCNLSRTDDDYNVSRIDDDFNGADQNEALANDIMYAGLNRLQIPDEAVEGAQQSFVYSNQHITPSRDRGISDRQISTTKRNSSANTTQQTNAGKEHSARSIICDKIQFGRPSNQSMPKTPEQTHRIQFSIDNLFSPELLENMNTSAKSVVAVDNSLSNDMMVSENLPENRKSEASEIPFNGPQPQFFMLNSSNERFSGEPSNNSFRISQSMTVDPERFVSNQYNMNNMDDAVATNEISFNETQSRTFSQHKSNACFSRELCDEPFHLSQTMATNPMSFTTNLFTGIPSINTAYANNFTELSHLDTMDPDSISHCNEFFDFPHTSNHFSIDAAPTRASDFKTPPVTYRSKSPDLFSVLSEKEWNITQESRPGSSSQKRLRFERLNDFNLDSQSFTADNVTVSPYFASEASLNETCTKNTDSAALSSNSRASITMAPTRKIPKIKLRSPTIFGASWTDNGSHTKPKPTKSNHAKKSQILEDILQRRNDVNLAEATERYRRIVEQVNADEAMHMPAPVASMASSTLGGANRSLPNEMAVSTPNESKIQKCENSTFVSTIRSIPNEMALSSPSEPKKRNNENSTFASSIRSVPGGMAVSTPNESRSQKYGNSTFVSAIRSVPGEMVLSSSIKHEGRNNENSTFVSAIQTLPDELVLSSSIEYQTHESAFVGGIRSLPDEMAVSTIHENENATSHDVIIIPPPEDFV